MPRHEVQNIEIPKTKNDTFGFSYPMLCICDKKQGCLGLGIITRCWDWTRTQQKTKSKKPLENWPSNITLTSTHNPLNLFEKMPHSDSNSLPKPTRFSAMTVSVQITTFALVPQVAVTVIAVILTIITIITVIVGMEKLTKQDIQKDHLGLPLPTSFPGLSLRWGYSRLVRFFSILALLGILPFLINLCKFWSFLFQFWPEFDLNFCLCNCVFVFIFIPSNDIMYVCGSFRPMSDFSLWSLKWSCLVSNKLKVNKVIDFSS